MLSFQLFKSLLFVFLSFHAGDTAFSNETATPDSLAERLFRQRCVRCHDLRMATRPIRPQAADSLVHAMRRYDPRWIKTEEVPVLVHFVREYHARRKSLIQSQSKRRIP